jgi:surface polysaccharide O-acyltransferase-like enzyme
MWTAEMSTPSIQQSPNYSEANLPEFQKLCIIQSSAFAIEHVWLLERIICVLLVLPLININNQVTQLMQEGSQQNPPIVHFVISSSSSTRNHKMNYKWILVGSHLIP